ncbi:phosphoesterase-domain-containing protein [Cryphonectria parasitica EP155]|uniref:Phosphoesterase-domain-containing protein n=1 Tax=Cryphonectria parasitica (strain ATCC 38755 / EP155) TaxID=660469 RepID=A0A9P4Y2Y8_CRYP1|nr:phosphoesterase-domain-containing protein [Cryphonectria parasitica EP155]KAF3765703.1 phosphoesterase-domain-containing protein [Cryphonectria parasitica EP155]
MRSQVLSLLAVATGSAVAQEYYTYTATSTQDVYAAQATAKTSSPVTYVKGKAFDRIAIIWLENTDYDLAIGDPNLAWLAQQGITLENYFGLTHPSEPNYAASHGGDYFGMDNDDLNFLDANISSIVDLLEEKNISWGEYEEDMPYSGFEGSAWVNQQTGANDYVRKHNPPVLYNSNSGKADRLAVMKNLTLFYEDLENETLPQWMFITPNMTDDGHDTSVTVAGAWTRNFLTPLLNDTRFMNNTLVLVTFDETSTYAIQNRVLAILLGDAVPESLVGTTDSNYYNHYSEIATVEANWDLHTLGRWDVGANVFSWVAELTGDPLREWDNATYGPFDSYFWNQSYDGVMNDAPSYPVYPAPNLDIESPSGRTVSPAIKAKWAGSTNPDYYENIIEVPDGLHPPAGYGGGAFAT